MHSVSELFVDNPGDQTDRIPVYLKMTLPKLNCDCKFLSIN